MNLSTNHMESVNLSTSFGKNPFFKDKRCESEYQKKEKECLSNKIRSVLGEIPLKIDEKCESEYQKKITTDLKCEFEYHR